MASNLSELEETKELVTFYELLENSFPENSTVVNPRESHESYLNELQALHFNGLDWRMTDLPDNENDSIEAAFDLIDDDAKLYYIAAYMRESIIDSYYQTGCLSQLKAFTRPGGLMARLTPYQRESVVWYCDLVEGQITEMPFMSRLEYMPNVLTAKHVKNTIRNTLW